MSKVQTLRVFVKQRLTAAAEEIFELFERTIAEYEEELGRHRKLLDAVFKPQVQLHRADVQQLLESEEEDPPEQQERSSSLDQEDPPELPHIKEEQEELWTSQEGEQLGGLEEADNTKFTFTPVTVKSEEDDEEKPQSSQLHQRQTVEIRDGERLKTEAVGEDCGGPEPAWNFNLQPATHDETHHFSEPETDDSCERQSGLYPLQNNDVPVSDVECNTGTLFSSSECATSSDYKGQEPELNHFSCPVCKKAFKVRINVVRHMRIHTGEKPFSCSICGMRFSRSSNLTSHIRVHTGEKPFTCSVCKTSFSDRSNLSQHMRIHTGERPFSCLVCDKKFTRSNQLRRHLSVHTGEKPFSCSVCNKRFTRLYYVKQHKCAVRGAEGNEAAEMLVEPIFPGGLKY
ncbi:uncharacterized protein [Pagrus major]|uniref:uncharacterized protein isoform X1 n=1 Tax=Pagrus major TaxID=143350 RepID=UPI003CC88ACA